MRNKKIVGYLAVALLLALVVLVLVSWLLSATKGEGVRSLLSSEGIRFFFGGFTDMLLKPLMVWLLLLSMAWGCLRQSGLLQSLPFISQKKHNDSSQQNYKSYLGNRKGIFLLLVMLVVYVGVVLLLTISPQAVLLSATGQLWPSPFSHALVPMITFGVLMLSVTYGLLMRRFLSIADVCQSLIQGIISAAPLLLLYVLAMQLFGALRFVFG